MNFSLYDIIVQLGNLYSTRHSLFKLVLTRAVKILQNVAQVPELV